MTLLVVWLINTLALILVAYLMPSISVAGFWSALAAAALLGLVNTFIRPILILLTLPVTILTLGLFIFVINGLLFWLVGALNVGLIVDGFWPAFWGAIVMGIISWALSLLTRGFERT